MQTLEDRFAFQMERIFGSISAALEEVPAALWPYYLNPPANQMYVPPLGDADGPAVTVRVNHGVWQTCCPFCPSAQHAAISDRRFFCATCLNAAAGNRTVPVTWPDDKTLLAVDTTLSARPFVTTQNWDAEEPVEQLLAENDGLRENAVALVGLGVAVADISDASPGAPSVVFNAANPHGD